jgi:hypothetical protein
LILVLLNTPLVSPFRGATAGEAIGYSFSILLQWALGLWLIFSGVRDLLTRRSRRRKR